MAEEEIKKLKNKKKRKLENQAFLERVQVDNATIQNIIKVGKSFKEKQRVQEEKEQIMNRDDREKRSGGGKDKEKEKNKSKGERNRTIKKQYRLCNC